MFRKFLLILTAVLLPCCLRGAVIGYCSGEYSKFGNFSVEGNTEVSGAVYLTQEVLAPYDGTDVVALRAALSSKVNIDRMTIWLRTSPDAASLAEVEVTSSTSPSLAKGWIEVMLETPVTIDASEGLYLGMTYHQKGATKAFSLVGSGFENSFFLRVGDSDWEDRHTDGILSVEAVTNSGTAPEYDLALIDATLDCQSSPEYNIATVKVANNGSRSLSGFSLEYSYRDSSVEPVTHHYDVELAPSEKTEVACEIPKIGNLFATPLDVRIIAVDNGQDSNSANDNLTARIPAVKKVLVEEYTTEACSNCPRVAGYMHEVCAEKAYEGRIVVICHHAGFGNDKFTQPCDEEMAEHYRIGSAPAVMYDRTPLSDGGMVECPDRPMLREAFDRQLKLVPSVAMSLNSGIDESTSELTVTVDLKREAVLDFGDPRLSVFVTEGNVKPFRQKGTEDDSFLHQHVIRAYNSTWGDCIVWDGSQFSAFYRFELDPEWKVEDLEIVAVVSNNSEDIADNRVDNVESCALKMSDIDEINNDDVAEEIGCYNLMGVAVAPDAPGILVKTVRYSDGRVESRKIINRP